MYQQTGEITPQSAIQEPLKPEVSRLRVVFISLVSLLVLVGASFISYAGIIHPLQIHAQATSVVNDIQTAQVQSSPQHLYNQITRETPVFNDPLDSMHGAWTDNQTCVFTKGAYHALAIMNTATSSACFNGGHVYRDFIFQIQITFIQGSLGSIVFRAADAQHTYGFAISNNGLYFATFVEGTGGYPLTYGRSTFIKPGLNQPNLLAVLAHGSTFSFFINKQFITSVADNNYISGEIGCGAGSPIPDNFDVAFSNAQVWSL